MTETYPPNPAASSSSAADAGQSAAGSAQIMDAISKLQDQQGNISDSLASLSENISKLSNAVSDQVSNQATVFGVNDQFENARRDRTAYDNVSAVALSMLSSMAVNTDAILKQHIRIVDLASSGHWGVPSAGRSSTQAA